LVSIIDFSERPSHLGLSAATNDIKQRTWRAQARHVAIVLDAPREVQFRAA
jgi:hypothetical protein